MAYFIVGLVCFLAGYIVRLNIQKVKDAARDVID